MTTNWTHFLDFAVALLNQPVPAIADEIQYRVIVGRAYYAAFHAARLHLETYYGQRWNVERGTHAQAAIEMADDIITAIAQLP